MSSYTSTPAAKVESIGGKKKRIEVDLSLLFLCPLFFSLSLSLDVYLFIHEVAVVLFCIFFVFPPFLLGNFLGRRNRVGRGGINRLH
jgi:hypothetical protein